MYKPFHLALPTNNLEETHTFYSKILHCKTGRKDKTWIDYNFYGHQLVFHYTNQAIKKNIKNHVDGKSVVVPHFGVIIGIEEWKKTKAILEQKIEFILEPYTRFKGTNGEQGTLFFEDCNGYAIEIKGLTNMNTLFKPF